jgi:hypothetical protein
MCRLRKPGPATSIRSTASPSRSSSASVKLAATSRGGSPIRGAASIAAFVE